MWDIIDEFIYQFQSFCQYRAKIMNKSEDEMIALKENVYKVLFFLSIAVSFEFLSLNFIVVKLEKEKLCSHIRIGVEESIKYS